MGHTKSLFKIVLVIQLVAFALATYGHPDAETIDFGSPTQPSRDQLIIEAAIKRGMDGDAVAELLRTKVPVTRTTTTPGGFTKTTTYKLEPDGSISSKSVLQKRKQYVYNSGSVPDNIPIDELQKSPTGTVTRIFTDSDGNKVTQTIAVSKPKATSVLDTDDLTGDWFNKPFPSAWPEESPSTGTVHRTVTRTFTGPNGERRTVQTFSSDPDFSEPETSYSPNYNTRTSTRTYTTSTRPEKPKHPLIGDIDWLTFDQPSFSKSWDFAGPEDTDDWEVLEGPEVTTKKPFESWTPKTWDWPQFPTRPSTTSTTTTTTVRPKLYIEPEPSTLKPLPNLEDFLKTQYGSPSNRNPSTTAKTHSTSSRSVTSTTPTSTTKFINIDDLPVVEVLHNGKPADEGIIKSLPPHLTPRPNTEQVLKVENKFPIENSKVETYIRTYSKTHTGPGKPSLHDLDPQMQEVLRRAGISPEDITNIDGDTITKTRKEPDGRLITTTYKVNVKPVEQLPSPVEPPVESHYKPYQPSSYPSSIEPLTPPVESHYKPLLPSSYPFNSYKPAMPSLTPLAPLTPHLSPISDFLAQLGLTKFDIVSRNNHYTKTFIDENGDVLTATFVLSSPKGSAGEEKHKAKPLK